MGKILALFSIILLPTLLVADRRTIPQPKPLVFTEVTVIDATGAPAKPDMTVVIIGNRITTLGKSGKVKIPCQSSATPAANSTSATAHH